MHEIESCRMAYPCQSCGKVIELRRFGRRPIYCSSKCRTVAHRQSGIATQSPTGELGKDQSNSPIEIIGEFTDIRYTKGRKDEKMSVPSSGVAERASNAPGAFRDRRRNPRAIPDTTYPGMWRVCWPDGRISDMANLSRVNDAIANFLDQRK